MPDDVQPRRRSLRLRDYDYAQAGAYFVTICTGERACILGQVVNDEVRLSALGQIIVSRWDDLPNHHPVELDAFIVMPNHVHGVVVILDRGVADGEGDPPPPPTTGQRRSRKDTLGAIIGSFKSATTRAVNEQGRGSGTTVWQRGYYEHVIRSEQALQRIRRYIMQNPAKWALDEENPARRATRQQQV